MQETSDGEFFIFHNDDIGGKRIADMPASDIRAIRLEGNFSIPSMHDTLALCGSGLILIVELKQVKSLEKFLGILRSYADVSRVVIVSFDRELISRMAVLAPEIMRAVITDAPVEKPREITQAVGSAAIGLSCRDVSAESVRRLHQEGTMVFVWGCPDAASVRAVMKFDIDGIISDYPDVVEEGKAHGS